MSWNDRWSERQRLMLEAMGLKIWLPPSVGREEPAPVQARAGAASHAEDLAHASQGGQTAVAERPRAPVAPLRAATVEDAPSKAGRGPGAVDVSAGEGAGAARPRADRVDPPAPQRVADVLSRALPGATTPTAETEVGIHQRNGLTREAIAQLDWDGLRSAVSDCRACGLCESRKNTVFGVGHPQAHWMIVGEAPGEQEDLQGEPFVGNAGKLLDNMLRALGLSRGEGPPEQQVYIANTLKCRPPRNRNPDPAELAQCEPFLQRQIELIQPRIILAMGRFAVQQLLQSQEAIGRLRGRVHRYQGVPLVVTYHPAYLLRNLPDKARAWEDLCLARQTLDPTTPSAD
ncbi:uracil-DNA glycosylase [Roseateles sp. SL47]|uniref:uracil-DNA glycosylase n=1 Tax=Roseateles sp. SL47 TaxID=2995138 RepID=UPI002271E91F|nr:uracil-DNA glycosylase family protein [Roseateles sp. SL47]WAC73572.1 uracil-DNA glycosylase [Roseateles sp. SL47]